MWSPETSNGSESLKIKWDLVPYTRGTGLDLGCGPVKPFPHFIGVDNNIDAKLFGAEASARQLTSSCERLPIFANESMDFVFSSHLLEHISDYRSALKEWWRVLKTGGHLCLYLPHKDFYPNIGKPGSNLDHKHDFLPADIVDAMRQVGSWDLLVNEDRNEVDEYSFFQVYRKSAEGQRESWLKPKAEKTCAVIRYGAYGDLLQTASVLPGLKEHGYRITFFCTPRGYEAVSNDPNIDEFVVQDEEQVPNHELGEFFVHLEKRYSKVVNMCETVEGIALPSAHRAHFHWPHEARHAMCNVNYVHLQHRIAGVPYRGVEGKFYPTKEESEWAQEQKRRAGGSMIAWALSGSAAHKVWPHVDAVLARIISETEATVVFLGGHQEQVLDAGWRHPRIWPRMGQLTIRQSMALAQVADVVVGPETGILNAVAAEPMKKVLLLSHSSIENLSRDWVNTDSMEPQATPCYPCHRLHLEGWKHCNRHPEGNALCQVNITPDRVFSSILAGIQNRDA